MPTYPPIHIADLPIGTELRVVMKGGRHLIGAPIRGNPNRLVVAPRTRVRRGDHITAFEGRLMANYPTQGAMTVQLRDPKRRFQAYTARIPYAAIEHIQRILTDVEGRQETAPASRPGVKALGTRVGPGDHSRGFVLAPVRM